MQGWHESMDDEPTGENVNGGHAVHEIIPMSDANELEGHGKHEEEPVTSLYVPFGHG